MNNSESFQQTEYKLWLAMSNESEFLHHCQTTDVFSFPCWGSNCLERLVGEALTHPCDRLLTFTAVRQDNYITITEPWGLTAIFTNLNYLVIKKHIEFSQPCVVWLISTCHFIGKLRHFCSSAWFCFGFAFACRGYCGVRWWMQLRVH